jgi:hypothetical protein
VSVCRASGGIAVFNGMVQYRRHRSVCKAAEFDCTK